MTADAILEKSARDAAGRLRWTVLMRLGVNPLSLTGRMLTRRRALRLAAQLILDGRGGREDTDAGMNPNFDMRRFIRLSGGEKR